MIAWIAIVLVVNLVMRYGMRRGEGIIPSNAFIAMILMMAGKEVLGLAVIIGLAISIILMVIINRVWIKHDIDISPGE